MKEYRARTARKGSEKAAGLLESLKARFRIYFPTNQTVCQSRGGRSVSWLSFLSQRECLLIQRSVASSGWGHDLYPGEVVAVAHLSAGASPRLRQHATRASDAQQSYTGAQASTWVPGRAEGTRLGICGQCKPVRKCMVGAQTRLVGYRD